MLTPQQKTLIRQTIPTLKSNGQALTDYFYQRMLKQVPELKETFNIGHQRNGRQAKALANAVLAYAEHIDDPSCLIPVIDLICHKHVSLNIQAPDYAIVGEHLLYSISEVLGIAMEDPLIDAWAAAYHDLAEIFINTEKRIYTEHQQAEGSWIGWRSFSIMRKVAETAEVTSFYLTPTDGQPLPNYLPGQYVSLRTDIPALGYKQPRQYSLSNAANRRYFRISVKEETGDNLSAAPGYVSSTLHHHLQVGDCVELSAPTGNFVLSDQSKPVVLISAGIGITPMVAMLEALTQASLAATAASKDRDHTPTISFIHAAKNAEHFALSQEVRTLVENCSKVTLFVTYDTPSTQPEIQHTSGRLNLKSLPASLLPANAHYYLCGPVEFVQAMVQDLQAIGIPMPHIFHEVFTTGGLSA